MKYNISVSVDENFAEMIEQIKQEAEDKGQSFSYAILSKLQKVTETKKETKGISLESDFDEVQKYARQTPTDELKKISHKANVMYLTLEAYIKWDSYEGDKTKKQFANAREAERYLKN